MKTELITSALSIAFLLSSATLSAEFPVLIDRPAPNFMLVDQYGKEVELSDYRGSRIILNFWASWCPPCRNEMPLLERLRRERKDVVVLAINTRDRNGKEFLEKTGLTLRVLFDSNDIVATLYQLIVLPTSVLIDESFVVRRIFRGEMNWDMMNELADYKKQPAQKKSAPMGSRQT